MTLEVEFKQSFLDLITVYNENEASRSTNKANRSLQEVYDTLETSMDLSRRAGELVNRCLESHSMEEVRSFLFTFSEDKQSIPPSLRSLLVFHKILS